MNHFRFSTTLLIFAVLTILTAMAGQASNIFSRLWRPFTTNATARFNPDQAAQATSTNSTTPSSAALCTIAAGCFWGPDHMYRQHFGNKGLIDSRVGYIGGSTNNPSYHKVCTGRTGHAEAIQVQYDPTRLSYRQLLEFFYQMHDPTTMNRQGGDMGTQYRSAIFYHDAEQEKVAKEVTKKVQDEWWKEDEVVTEVLPAGQWWDAEDYHQKYLEQVSLPVLSGGGDGADDFGVQNPGGYHCPSQ